MFGNFVQDILAVSEPVGDDPRTHISQNHKFDRGFKIDTNSAILDS